MKTWIIAILLILQALSLPSNGNNNAKYANDNTKSKSKNMASIHTEQEEEEGSANNPLLLREENEKMQEKYAEVDAAMPVLMLRLNLDNINVEEMNDTIKHAKLFLEKKGIKIEKACTIENQDGEEVCQEIALNDYE